jgi:putative transposase
MIRTWKKEFIENAGRVFNERQCELIGISRSTHYYQPRKQSSEATDRKEAIMAEIDRVHTEYPCYGQRRIRKLLNDAGYPVGRKLIRRYMQEMCICPIYPKPNLSKRNHRESIVPYLLRNMEIYLPNQVWSIDITYVKLHKSHMYLTAIID